MQEKRYTLAEMARLGLVKKIDGNPYKKDALRALLKRSGIKKTGVNDKGTPLYQVTEKQIDKLNTL